MCGIVGYVRNKKASQVLINILQKLECRVFDSAGIAVSEVYQPAVQQNKVFFIVCQFDSVTSLEIALKFKDVSYMYFEAFAARELKHGPIALIDNKTLFVAIAS